MNEKTEPQANGIHFFVREVKTCRQSNYIDDDSNIPMAGGSYRQKDREIQEQTNIEEVKNKSFDLFTQLGGSRTTCQNGEGINSTFFRFGGALYYLRRGDFPCLVRRNEKRREAWKGEKGTQNEEKKEVKFNLLIWFLYI